MSKITVHNGDCLDVLTSLPECSIDAVVTDPPYHLTAGKKGGTGLASVNPNSPAGRSMIGTGFMGKAWDGGDIAFRSETWAKVMRVLKPGGHLVAFGAPKNYHRLACAIEDAGFEIRDSLMWVFGQGFPKSLDISKAIDKAAGAEREKIAIGNPVKRIIPGADQDASGSWIKNNGREYQPGIEIAATDEAKEWAGWGTALKPAYEPIVLARKPLSEGTVAANVLRWGTGALNIDACRVEGVPRTTHADGNRVTTVAESGHLAGKKPHGPTPAPTGRWPANLCHSGEQGVLDLFPQSKSGNAAAGGHKRKESLSYKSTVNYADRSENAGQLYGDEGSAARFFYCAKASKHDRAGSKHPTVKPVALMQWLIRMVTPPGGTILDPFAGSGTTGQAAINEAVAAIMIESEKEYYDDIMRRIA